MTVLTLNRKELEKKIGKVSKEVEDKISMFGTPVESSDENEVQVEVFPNRPDLLSLQGFARTMNTYLNKKQSPVYEAKKPEKNYKVIVEKSVKGVKPYTLVNESPKDSRIYTVCAIVKNLVFTDDKIKEIVDIQEKLHLTLGRKRKKLAIGVYPLEKITLPITFSAKKPEEIKFIPLESDKEMNGRQILSRHAAGREYAHLLKDQEIFPVFTDAKNKVLSMPPVINSHETGKISSTTKEIFIECSGFNLPYLKKTLNILVSALADMGGEVYSMEIEDQVDKKTFISPSLEPEKIEFKTADINKTLGLTLSEKEVQVLLAKMSIGYEQKDSKSFALIPAYRTDVLHWVDLAEEVAIAYGYENFKPEIPKISTIAEEDKMSIVKKTIASVLAGLGFLETSSYHLTVRDDVRRIQNDFKDFIEVEESKTEYNILRNDLLPNQLKILSENSDSSYPQRIFETGRVFLKNEKTETGIEERERLAIALAGENTNFTEIKQVLDYLFKMLGKQYELKEAVSSAFIVGRTGKILVDKKEVGVIGEIHPRIIKSFKLKLPIAALELDLGMFFG